MLVPTQVLMPVLADSLSGLHASPGAIQTSGDVSVMSMRFSAALCMIASIALQIHSMRTILSKKLSSAGSTMKNFNDALTTNKSTVLLTICTLPPEAHVLLATTTRVLAQPTTSWPSHVISGP